MPPLTLNRRDFLGSAAASLFSIAQEKQQAAGDSGRGESRDSFREAQIPSRISRYSGLRGFNYTPSNAYNDIYFWRDYDEGLVERELDFARRLSLNSARIFLHYVVYEHERERFLKRVRHFVRAAHERGISTMPVIWDSCFSEVQPSYDTKLKDWIPNPGVQRLGPDFWPSGERYCRDLVQNLGPEPGLLLWDIMNEPLMTSYIWTNPPDKEARIKTIWSFVRHFLEIMAELDTQHARTVGNAYAADIEETAEYVDVVSFHDYSPNRTRLRAHLSQGIQTAASLNKPVLVSEVGCVARSNPYDMTLENCRDLNVSWYVWELMIGVSRWNDIHGIVYPDGTVRDPSIAAAVQGFFRKRKGAIIPYKLDKEGAVKRVLDESEKWRHDKKAPYTEGLTLLQEMSNLLESGQLIAMNTLPSVQAMALQEESAEHTTELRRLLKEWGAILKTQLLPQT
jgi:hypothetical protein